MVEEAIDSSHGHAVSGRRQRAICPEVVRPAREALREQTLRAVHIAGAEGGLEQGVVKDVALGAAAAQRDQRGRPRARPQRAPGFASAGLPAGVGTVISASSYTAWGHDRAGDGKSFRFNAISKLDITNQYLEKPTCVNKSITLST